MTPGTSSDSSSPRASGHKVQNGRIEKSKSKKELKQPTYRIGGRTFACEACKKGHRVSKCTHASERPVSMTNDPGRPSGDQKRHCDCPKQCACTKKNCKCDRNCNCTQTMYMLVCVPMKDGEKVENGEWQISEEVITDLQGKKLTDEEIRIRNELKQMQQTAKSGIATPGPLRTSLTTSDADSAVKSCCQHKKNIEEQKQPIPSPEELTTNQRRPQCDCGTGCTCAFCLDHPNNQTSHFLAQQQAAYFSNQSLNQHQVHPTWTPPQVGGSCMGTNPRFAISNTPNPSQSQFQTLFPAVGSVAQGGYFISYPFTRYTGFIQPAFIQPMHSPMLSTPMSDPLLSPYTIETTPLAASVQPSKSSCCHAETEESTCAQQEEPALDVFDFSSYDIGDAVASGWNGSDQFSFDETFNAQIPSFANEPSWDPSIDPLPDIGATPIPNVVDIRPSPTSPSRPSTTPDQFAYVQRVASSPALPRPENCLHHACCQHGVVHYNPQILHQGLQTGLGLPFHDAPTPTMQSVYARSPS